MISIIVIIIYISLIVDRGDLLPVLRIQSYFLPDTDPTQAFLILGENVQLVFL